MSAAVENANEGSNPSSGKSQPMVVCSVCLEAVAEGVERSIAKLKCGHHFHLDCIGSAFNAKGRMQCPNCRQVEQGQWLYANGCFLHEDLVDDLTFEEDAEVFSAAGHLQFGHTPWCPHAGSYPHFSLTFEELDNLVNIYLDPSQNVTRGLRAPAAVGGLICPYLAAAQGLPSGGLSNHFQDFIALHVDHHNRANRVMEDATHGLQTVSAATSAFSSFLTSYGGSSESYYNPNAGILQPHARHLAVGFLVGSPQSAHAGFSHGTNFGGHPFLSQLPHGRNAQGSYGNVHPHPMNFSRNGHINVRRTRHGDILSTPQRTTQVSSLERAQMNEPVHDYCSWASPSVLGQIPNQVFRGDQIGWAAACSHIEPWTRGVYPPQISYETSSHSWAWVPSVTNQGQRAMRNVALNTYHEGQVFGALRPTASLPGFSEQASEGAYAWVISRSQ